jgi:hypothetical protein
MPQMFCSPAGQSEKHFAPLFRPGVTVIGPFSMATLAIVYLHAIVADPAAQANCYNGVAGLVACGRASPIHTSNNGAGIVGCS